MADAIDFYFDFSSPYGYLASTQIDTLAVKHGRVVNWRPFLLGVAFKTTGQRPLPEQPLRGPYSLRDFDRSARLLGVPFRLPEPFPFPSLAACRAFYWLEDSDEAKASKKIKQLSIARLLGEAIRRIHNSDSVSSLFV